MNERYVLHHDGTWFYYLGADALGCEALADRVPMALLGNDHRAGWWAAGHQAQIVELRKPRPPAVTGYRLRDPSAQCERFPAELSVSEYTQACDVSGHSPEYALYEPVMAPAEVEVTQVDGRDWIRLDGEPPPDDGHTWKASLPYVLSNRREYLHLFPGYMGEFRDRMRERLKSLPRVRYVLEKGPRLEVTLEVPFDAPATEYRPAFNRDGSASRSRKGRTVPKLATRVLSLAVPYRIDGANRAAAVAEWERCEADLVAAVTSASVAACSACGGRGYVPTDAGDRP